MESPRYFKGREQILVKTAVKSNVPDSPDYMEMTNGATEKFVTHRARIESIEKDCFVVTDSNSE